MSKKLICCVMALLLLSVCLPVLAETAGPVPALLPSVRTPVSGMDSADAFAGYVNRVFGIGGASAITPRNASLTGFNKAIYDLLVPLIEDTAAGNIASSVFTVDVSDAAAQLGIQPDDLMYSPEDLGLSSFYDAENHLSGEALNAYYQRAGFNMGTIVHALMVNLPYDLYWFDKTSGFSPDILLYTTDEGEKISLFSSGELTLSMDVAQEFSAGSTAGTTDLNTALTSAASSAAATARMIAESSGQLSDSAKLSAFKDAVCHRVSYDHEAAEDDHRPYGNPWQLIWVFDDDPDTNVVCEGYSKAFKYLCDLSSFTNPDLSVSIVSGWMSGGTGEGAHMWNLVSMGSGANYLADITNCDEGSVGYPDELFMAGSGRPYSDNGLSGYIFSANGSDIVYAYDGDMAGLYTEAELTVSDTAYTEEEPQIVADGVCGDDLTWTLDENGLLTVSGTGPMTDYETDTAVPWSACRDEIIRTVIEPGVASVGAHAFHNCANMTGVSLPQGLTGIGDCAFTLCESMAGIDIPDSVTSISQFAFCGCSALTGLALPSGLTSIGAFAFQNCTGLTGNLTIPSSVAVIGEYAFQNCPGLDSPLVLPEGLTAIANGAFSRCSGLTGNLVLPSSVAEIGEYAFEYCSGLTGLIFPSSSSVASIGACSFYLCTGLVSPLTLPEGLETIGDGAFNGCSGLTSLTFPSSLNSIGGWSFQNCTGIVSPLALPEGLTAIADGAFSGCSGLTGNLVLPSTLTSLGRWVFSGCTGFSGYLQIPGSLPGIADGTFYECDGLTDIYYAGTADDWYAVAPNPGPYNGAALHFGAAVSESGWFGTGNPFLWILDSRGQLLVRGSGSMESFWDDQDIPWYPYRQDIFFLTVMPGVTGIGANAFKQLTQLIWVSLPDGLEYIGGCAFDHCESLPEISLPESVATIDWYSFGSCYALTDIFIPRSLTTIGDAALAYCFELSQITVDADNPAFTTDDGVLLTMDRTELVCYPPKKDNNFYFVPDTVTTIRTEAFSACENLSLIFLPPRLESIGESAFSWCSQLSQIRIPAGVAAIPQKAFSYCSSLTAIHIPESVRSIGNNAFYRCDRLAAVYYFGTQQEWNAVIIEDNNESLTNAVLRIIFPDLILPAQLTAIESEAFAGVPEGSVIFVPETVSEIAPDAFDPGTVIVTPVDSYAAGWAAENGFVCFEQ